MMVMDRGLVYADLLRLRQEYREYRDAHWDAERGHIKPEYAEGLYRIFREGIVARRAYDKIEQARQPQEPRVIQQELNFNAIAV
jgi:hypothetical protein